MRKRALLATVNNSMEQLQWMNARLQELGIDVIAGIGHRGMSAQFSQAFPAAHYRSISLFDSPEPWRQPLDLSEFYATIGSELDAALPLCERYPPAGGGTIEAMTRLFHEFSCATELLDSSDPDLLLFVKEPESVLEYLIYRLGKRRNIRTIMTRAGLMPFTRLASTNFEKPVLNEDETLHEDSFDLSTGQTKTQQPFKESHEILTRLRNEDAEYSPEYMRTQRIQLSSKSLIFSGIREESLVSLLNGGLKPNSGSILKWRLLRQYKRLCNEGLLGSDIDSDKSFSIYFPLHYQPEQTTMPLGGRMVNQVMAIKLLSDLSPSDTKIYVKEHPSTFAQKFRITSAFRTPQTYSWISRIPKVQLVPLEQSSRELIRHCDLTATIRGTASWEAAALGRLGIVFGFTSFATMPGLIDASSEPVTVLTRVFGGRIPAPASIDEVDAYVGSMDSCSFHANDAPDLSEKGIVEANVRIGALARAAEIVFSD